MKLLEMKNKLALETAKLIFQNNINPIFIGGTALNAFYLDYRYSEDLDLAYTNTNISSEIESLLSGHGYTVSRTNVDFRYLIDFEGVSIKLDILEYKKKYNGFTEKAIGQTKIKTLKIEEFLVEKVITFFTREDLAGSGRDGYDLFSIDRKYSSAISITSKAKKIILSNIVSLNHNLGLFQDNIQKIENAVNPYLKIPVDSREVLEFLKAIQGVLRD